MILPIVSISHCIVLISGYPPPPIPPPAYGSYPPPALPPPAYGSYPPQALPLPPPLGYSGGGYGPGYRGYQQYNQKDDNTNMLMGKWLSGRQIHYICAQFYSLSTYHG